MKESEIEDATKVLIGVYVPPEVKAALEARAQANERSLSGEIRRAIAKHLAEGVPQ